MLQHFCFVRTALLAIWLLLTALLANGQQTGRPAATQPAGQAAQAAKSTTTDAVIEATLRSKLAKSKVGADGFRFRVQNGVVYWDGSTNVVQHKGAATRMAKTSGARAVVNNIAISESARKASVAGLHESPRKIKVQSGTTARSEARSQ